MTEITEQIDKDIDINIKITNEQPEPSLRTRFLWQFLGSVLAIGGSILSIYLSGQPLGGSQIASAIIGGVIGIHLPQPRLYK